VTLPKNESHLDLQGRQVPCPIFHPVAKVTPMSEIVPFAHAANPAPALAQTAIDQVCAYWASLPRNGLAPNRADVDASAIAGALPDLFIAEFVTPRVARLRLVGHRVEDLLDMEMRGMPLTALFTGPARPVLTDALEQVARGARVILPLDGEVGFGLPALTGQMALLPLCDQTGAITRVMGVILYQGTIGRKSRRLNVSAPHASLLPPLTASIAPAPRKTPAFRVIVGGKI